VKFDTGEFHQILSRNPESGYDRITISGTLQEGLPFILLATVSTFEARQGRRGNPFLRLPLRHSSRERAPQLTLYTQRLYLSFFQEFRIDFHCLLLSNLNHSTTTDFSTVVYTRTIDSKQDRQCTCNVEAL